MRVYDDLLYKKFLFEEIQFIGTWDEYVSSLLTHRSTPGLPYEYYDLSVPKADDWLTSRLRWSLKSMGSFRVGHKTLEMARQVLQEITKPNATKDIDEIDERELSINEVEVGDSYYLKGNKVKLASINRASGIILVHDDKPITFKINRLGRKVVEHDPSCIRSFASLEDLRRIITKKNQGARVQPEYEYQLSPPLSLLQMGYCGPYREWPSDPVFSATVKRYGLDSESSSILAGHIKGWLACGIGEGELNVFVTWCVDNLLTGRDIYSGASTYAASTGLFRVP